MKVKAFDVTGPMTVEKPINDWLDENNKIKIHHVTSVSGLGLQSKAGEVLIFYDGELGKFENLYPQLRR